MEQKSAALESKNKSFEQQMFQKNEEIVKNWKYWSNAAGDLFRPEDLTNNVIKPKDLPDELQVAYEKLWTDGCGSFCYLVETKGDYGVALINEYGINVEEGLIDNRARETLKMLNDKDIPWLIVCNDEENRELIVILPWDSTKENFDKVSDFLCKTAYDKSVTYEDYKASENSYAEIEQDDREDI